MEHQLFGARMLQRLLQLLLLRDPIVSCGKSPQLCHRVQTGIQGAPCSPTQVQRLLQQDLHRPGQRHRLPLIQAAGERIRPGDRQLLLLFLKQPCQILPRLFSAASQSFTVITVSIA